MLSEDQVCNRLIKKCSRREQNNISVKWVDDSNRILIDTELQNTREPEEGGNVTWAEKLRKSLFWQWTQMKSYKADFERDV